MLFTSRRANSKNRERIAKPNPRKPRKHLNRGIATVITAHRNLQPPRAIRGCQNMMQKRGQKNDAFYALPGRRAVTIRGKLRNVFRQSAAGRPRATT